MNIYLHTYTLPVPFFLRNVRHTGVEVFGKEYTFSMGGITICKPTESCVGKYVKSYVLEKNTKLTYDQFQKILDALGKIYRPNTYHFVYKNCNHFCDDLVELLCGKRLLYQFMFYSKVGKLLGKMKNFGFCGTYPITNSKDKILYDDISKVSKLIRKENEMKCPKALFCIRSLINYNNKFRNNYMNPYKLNSDSFSTLYRKKNNEITQIQDIYPYNNKIYNNSFTKQEKNKNEYRSIYSFSTACSM